MKRWLLPPVAGLCFVASLLCIRAAWPDPEPPEPDLWTDTSTLDHGDVWQGQELRGEFQLVNHYSQALEIIDVMKGCACSAAKVDSKHLQPGAKTTLRVLWKTGASRGRTSFNVHIGYRLADGSDHHKALRVEGNVVPDIAFEPKNPTFDGTRPEIQSIRFAPGRLDRFTLFKAYCNHAAFKAKLGENVVEVAFDGTTPVYGNGLEPRLLVETDSENEPRIVVPIALRAPLPTQ